MLWPLAVSRVNIGVCNMVVFQLSMSRHWHTARIIIIPYHRGHRPRAPMSMSDGHEGHQMVQKLRLVVMKWSKVIG